MIITRVTATFFGRYSNLSKMGSKKAAVLPLPVVALAHTSLSRPPVRNQKAVEGGERRGRRVSMAAGRLHKARGDNYFRKTVALAWRKWQQHYTARHRTPVSTFNRTQHIPDKKKSPPRDAGTARQQTAPASWLGNKTQAEKG